MHPRIKKLEVVDSRRLLLHYADGRLGELDGRKLAKLGGICARLAEPEYFSAVKKGYYGYFLIWPDELDIGADSLLEHGRIIASPELAARKSANGNGRRAKPRTVKPAA